MTLERLLALLSIVALACVGATAIARSVALARAGVWVLPVDRERSAREVLIDVASVAALGAFVWEAIATAAAGGRILDLPRLPSSPPWVALRLLGVPVAAVAVALYVRTLRDFGLSWRFTIDRAKPGQLVIHGVFAYTRNPVYLALMLLAGGVALMLGSPLLLGIAGGAPFYFRALVRREEAFLVRRYGRAYEQYCTHAPRWLR